jgi:hypothetical protein
MNQCQAHNAPELPYLQWHYDAERRGKRGERQYKCLLCGLWQWEEHYTDKNAMGDSDLMERKRAMAAYRKEKKAAR